MSKNVSLRKGKVVIEDKFTASEEELIKSKHRAKKAFEFWRTRHTSLLVLKELSNIDDLSFINCKIGDPSALAHLATLKRLFFNGTQVSSGLGFLSDLSQIEELHLLNLKGNLTLPSFKNLDALKRFRVWGCKKLSDVSALEEVRNLEEVELIDTALEPDDLLALLKKPSTKYINPQFKTQRHNDAFAEYLARYNKSRHRFP